MEDKVYQSLVANGDQWAAELDSRIWNTSMSVRMADGKQYWLDWFDDGYFVPVIWFPRSRWGMAGYFYSQIGEPPTLGPDDEVTHLEGNVYCYILDDPG